jgi:hypothetical protein
MVCGVRKTSSLARRRGVAVPSSQIAGVDLAPDGRDLQLIEPALKLKDSLND